MALPEDLVAQFRTVALERLDRIENAWAQVLAQINDDAANLLHREVHTLKGESRVLGFTDVNLVCHKLEDMLELARTRGYAVDDDFDLSVNMALRFMGMLVHKKVGERLGGIDLPGFVKQIDEVLAKATEQGRPRTRTGKQAVVAKPRAMTLPQALRDQLGPLAVDAFIEYASSRGHRRNRLRASWQSFRDLIGLHRAVVGTAQLIKHRTGALSLAKELGKHADVSFELGTAEVTTEMLAALDVAALHLIRNAIDHGITQSGRVRLRGGARDDGFVLVVEDDGPGINWDQIRARAIELGLLDASIAPQLEAGALLEVMCQPGFSTRREASDVSGRGVGLDAVRAAVTELGGALSVASSPGGGTAWTVRLPPVQLTMPALAIHATGLPFPVLFDASWQRTDRPGRALDLARELGVGSGDGGVPYAFASGDRVVVVPCVAPPEPVVARRVIATLPEAIGEVVVIETTEALLLRPRALI